MYVKLLKTIMGGGPEVYASDNGGDLDRMAEKWARINGHKVRPVQIIKNGKILAEFKEGNVVHLSEASGKKYVERGWAVEVPRPEGAIY